ncbi:unnamed protein product [Caenorhabditis auriculariae]|uniref:Uncharacterized protein n=1 Tax=Caenorhabditis auriculariae TaxID=2777116 RepID=A0A8S1HIR5_9PELO|nr:unnamed protein product [Caenorhabditis auriculariae]
MEYTTKQRQYVELIGSGGCAETASRRRLTRIVRHRNLIVVVVVVQHPYRIRRRRRRRRRRRIKVARRGGHAHQPISTFFFYAARA